MPQLAGNTPARHRWPCHPRRSRHPRRPCHPCRPRHPHRPRHKVPNTRLWVLTREPLAVSPLVRTTRCHTPTRLSARMPMPVPVVTLPTWPLNTQARPNMPTNHLKAIRQRPMRRERIPQACRRTAVTPQPAPRHKPATPTRLDQTVLPPQTRRPHSVRACHRRRRRTNNRPRRWPIRTRRPATDRAGTIDWVVATPLRRGISRDSQIRMATSRSVDASNQL